MIIGAAKNITPTIHTRRVVATTMETISPMMAITKTNNPFSLYFFERNKPNPGRMKLIIAATNALLLSLMFITLFDSFQKMFIKLLFE